MFKKDYKKSLREKKKNTHMEKSPEKEPVCVLLFEILCQTLSFRPNHSKSNL